VEYICSVDGELTKAEKENRMVSLKTFVEDIREERRDRNERLLRAFTLVVSVLFLALSVWSTTL
jgi:hypothetical protein